MTILSFAAGQGVRLLKGVPLGNVPQIAPSLGGGLREVKRRWDSGDIPIHDHGLSVLDDLADGVYAQVINEG